MEGIRACVEIGLLFCAFYAILQFMHGTRGEGILRGYVVFLLVILILVLFITQRLELRRIAYLLGNFLAISFFSLVIIFQPELRNGLIRLGRNPFMRRLFTKRPPFLEEVLFAVDRLSRNKIGALIAVERQVGLGTYIDRGVPLDAECTRQLLSTIFWPGSPLHDGAVVIRDERIAAAGCLFPLTENPEGAAGRGTRHRAAVGLTDETDALVIAVSEEDGAVSLARKSTLAQQLSLAQLGELLDEALAGPTEQTT